MGFIENFKIKRAAKKAKALYQLELNEWEQENRVLNAALDIFTTASKGDVSKVRKLFLDFQKNLYLPHKEYQRVS